MRKFTCFISLMLTCFIGHTQTLGGRCEGCEALLEYGDQPLQSTDTLPDFQKNEPKLVLSGTVFESDGQTPAEGVIIYVYHTNREGIYPTQGNERGWARRHGYIRGWAITDQNGRYTFYTFQPASYPSRTDPAHIHMTIKEPGKKEYWIDSVHFEEDPLLTTKIRNNMSNRGGNGIVSPKQQGNYLLVERNIILGENIPHYH
ncbi:intradiol ring-cleavage dioxygenase [Roseivirga sp.]|uniref:dioxygenase family protein n=1 Tax=Roseivirga sp. TaxID=1964215 RepID=UPI003B52254A